MAILVANLRERGPVAGQARKLRLLPVRKKEKSLRTKSFGLSILPIIMTCGWWPDLGR
jgi:hypothetical protein